MELESTVKGLHPLEIRLLRHVREGKLITPPAIMREIAFNQGQCNQALSWLSGKGLIQEEERRRRQEFSLTETGRGYLNQGTPEERVVNLLQQEGSLTLPEIVQRLGLESREVGSAYGNLAKAGLLAMNEEKQVSVKDACPRTSLTQVRDLLNSFQDKEVVEQGELSPQQLALITSLSRKRGASRGPFRQVEREEVSYRLTSLGIKVRGILLERGITGEEIGILTPEMLKNAQWRERPFRAYNIKIPPPRVLLGRKNPYVEFLEQLKNKLIALGFEEFDGPLVETEFWNSDALYMPQFHSARDIHDVYHVKDPDHAEAIEQPYLEQVASTHEDGWKTGSLGWRYRFDREFTRRLILRSHGTVLSAKSLPRARVPGKYFGVVRCFRYDRVDATHLADFYQTEGIVLGEEVNLKTLLGLLKMFAVEVAGAEEYKFVPGYFPFTEPSVEAHIKHPQLGWFELGGSGIFRPEVTEPLGVKVPVLAWGLGIDRMALVAQGLNDLRDLFSLDIEQVRLRRRR